MEIAEDNKLPPENSKETIEENKCTTRASAQGKLIEIGKSTTTTNTSTSDAIRIWNMAPRDITESTTVWQAKEKIKAYAKSLPVLHISLHINLQIHQRRTCRQIQGRCRNSNLRHQICHRLQIRRQFCHQIRGG